MQPEIVDLLRSTKVILLGAQDMDQVSNLQDQYPTVQQSSETYPDQTDEFHSGLVRPKITSTLCEDMNWIDLLASANSCSPVSGSTPHHINEWPSQPLEDTWYFDQVTNLDFLDVESLIQTQTDPVWQPG